MEEDILGSVVEVERDIQQQIEAEKNRAAEWLEGVRTDAEKQVLQEESRLRGSLEQTLENARSDARERAGAFSEKESSKTSRLQNLTDDTLKRALLRHLAKILPET